LFVGYHEIVERSGPRLKRRWPPVCSSYYKRTEIGRLKSVQCI
jgi:hypothetical protein